MEIQQKKTHKRTPEQRELDLVEIAQLYAKQWSQHEIAAHLNKTRPYTISRSQIAHDMKLLYAQWETEIKEAGKHRLASELKQLEYLQREAMEEYTRSKEDATETIFTKAPGKNDEEKKTVRVKKTGQTGNPAYLAIALQCLERRAKLLGLDAPQKQELELGGKAGSPIVMQSAEMPKQIIKRVLDSHRKAAEYDAKKKAKAAQAAKA